MKVMFIPNRTTNPRAGQTVIRFLAGIIIGAAVLITPQVHAQETSTGEPGPMRYSATIPGTMSVRVTDPEYGAVADGKTVASPAIQKAIDAVAEVGGGTVIVPAGTYLSGPIILKSSIHLRFETGTVMELSDDPAHHPDRPCGRRPVEGEMANHDPGNRARKWNFSTLRNVPFLYGPEGTSNIRITGPVVLRAPAIKGTEGKRRIHCPMIGFFGVSDFEITDITLESCVFVAMGIMQCSRGSLRNVSTTTSGDGNYFANCQDIHFRGGTLNCRDDAIVITAMYKEVRSDFAWWKSDDPQPTRHLLFEDVDFIRTGCQHVAFGPWGGDHPDQTRVEISDVVVRNCRFNGKKIGGWPDRVLKAMDPKRSGRCSPMKDVHFVGNEYKNVSVRYLLTFSYLTMSPRAGGPPPAHWRSMEKIQNNHFAQGICWWVPKTEGGSFAGTRAGEADGTMVGVIDALDRGPARLFQGIFLTPGKYHLQARIRAKGAACRLFVSSCRNGREETSLGHHDFANAEWRTVALPFTVEKETNVVLGIERGQARSGSAVIAGMDVVADHPKNTKALRMSTQIHPVEEVVATGGP